MCAHPPVRCSFCCLLKKTCLNIVAVGFSILSYHFPSSMDHAIFLHPWTMLYSTNVVFLPLRMFILKVENNIYVNPSYPSPLLIYSTGGPMTTITPTPATFTTITTITNGTINPIITPRPTLDSASCDLYLLLLLLLLLPCPVIAYVW